LHLTLRVVAVAGLESAFLSTATETRTQLKDNKKVRDFNEPTSPLINEPAIETTQCCVQD